MFSDFKSFVIIISKKIVVAVVGDHPYFDVFVIMSKVRLRTQPL